MLKVLYHSCKEKILVWYKITAFSIGKCLFQKHCQMNQIRFWNKLLKCLISSKQGHRNLVCLSKFVLIWTPNTSVWFCIRRQGGFQKERSCVECMNCTKNYIHFSKQKSMNVSVSTFNVNFGCRGLNTWQKYLPILIASTQACKVEKKTLWPRQISWLLLTRELQFGRTEIKMATLKCFLQ